MKHPISIVQWIGFPISILYGFIQALRRSLYKIGFIKAYRLPGKVISIGNIEVGGTGKSPVTVALASKLVEEGFNPVIVTRGYRSGLNPEESAGLLSNSVIMPPQKSTSFFADEARMQSALLPTVPVVIGCNRIEACKRYLKHNRQPSHWILDDGFQHLQIARQANIVLMDEKFPLDNGMTLPSGRLREWSSSLRDADFILLTRSKLKTLPKELSPYSSKIGFSCFFHDSPKLVHSPNREKAPLETWKYFLVSAIAKPETFKEDVRNLGYKLCGAHCVRDHSPLILSEFKDQINLCDAILTTEKDFYRDVKIFEDLSVPVITIPLKANIDEIPENIIF